MKCSCNTMVNLSRYNFIYPFVLKAIGCLGDVREGKKVRRFVVKTGTGFEAYMCKSFIDMYPELGMVESFWQALDEMPERNRLCWNVTILGYVRCRRFEDALDMFWRMRCESMEKPDEVTVASTLSACTELKNFQHEFTTKIGNALSNMHVNCGCLIEGRIILYERAVKNVFCCTSMVYGYGNCVGLMRP
ncbi:unnamed protein product [Malus baccata var. baccata]